eukprot:3789473-Rhodomonas_salina.1
MLSSTRHLVRISRFECAAVAAARGGKARIPSREQPLPRDLRCGVPLWVRRWGWRGVIWR